jgi:hypothetical protein
MDVRIFAVDAGATTGWVCARVRVDERVDLADAVAGRNDEVYGQIQMPDHFEGAMELYRLVEMWNPDMLVIEDFVLRGMGSTGQVGISSCRIGCYLAGIVAGRGMSGIGWSGGVAWYPAPAKKTGPVSDAVLREMGLWVVGQEHVRSAYRMWLLHLRHLRKVANNRRKGVR